MTHLDYLEKAKMTTTSWEKSINSIAQALADVLHAEGCSYYDAKAALNKAGSILEEAMLRAKV